MSKEPEKDFTRRRKLGLLIEVGRYREALAEISSILAVESDNYNLLCQKALCHFKLTEYQLGFNTTKTAIASSPESEWAYRLQSLIFTANGEHKRALESAEIAIQKAPYAFETVQTLFFAQANYGLLAQAMLTLKTVLELSPESAIAHFAAGYLALKEKDLSRAESCFLEALKIDPESTNALNNLGVVYIEMANSGKGEKYRGMSVEMFERAVRSEPTLKLAQSNIKAASDKPAKPRRSAGIFAICFFLLSSPLQTILYLAFSDRLNMHTSYADVFSPVIGDAVLIGVNLVSILILVAFAVFGVFYYFVDDQTRIPAVAGRSWFWLVTLCISLGFIILYLFLMFYANTDISSFPGMAVRGWFILAIVSGVGIANLRNSNPN